MSVIRPEWKTISTERKKDFFKFSIRSRWLKSLLTTALAAATAYLAFIGLAVIAAFVLLASAALACWMIIKSFRFKQ